MDLGTVKMDEVQAYPLEAIAERARGCGREWCHLWCEPGDEEALHRVAAALGQRRDWFQNREGFPHYDLTKGVHYKARRIGVPVVSLHEWVRAKKGNGKTEDGKREEQNREWGAPLLQAEFGLE